MRCDEVARGVVVVLVALEVDEPFSESFDVLLGAVLGPVLLGDAELGEVLPSEVQASHRSARV
jgi:hypothetical protein